jgi:hypothetical protein
VGTTSRSASTPLLCGVGLGDGRRIWQKLNCALATRVLVAAIPTVAHVCQLRRHHAAL